MIVDIFEEIKYRFDSMNQQKKIRKRNQVISNFEKGKRELKTCNRNDL